MILTMCVLHMITVSNSIKKKDRKRNKGTLEMDLAELTEKGGKTHHLKAENFMASQSRLFSPPRLTGSMQMGHKPTLSTPLPFTKRGVYRSNTRRGGL